MNSGLKHVMSGFGWSLAGGVAWLMPSVVREHPWAGDALVAIVATLLPVVASMCGNAWGRR